MEYDNCIKCNEPKQPEAIECHNCGVIYTKAEAVEIKRAKEEEKRKIELEKDCPHCGTEIYDNEINRCQECGEDLSLDESKNKNDKASLQKTFKEAVILYYEAKYTDAITIGNQLVNDNPEFKSDEVSKLLRLSRQKLDEQIKNKKTAHEINFKYQYAPDKVTIHSLISACRFSYAGKIYIWGTCKETQKHQIFGADRIVSEISVQGIDKTVPVEKLRDVTPPEEWTVEGKKKPLSAENKETTCPYCGETILAVAIKCKHCKEFLVEESDVNQIRESNVEMVQDSDLNLIKCTDCGARIEKQSGFCPECGVLQLTEEKAKSLNKTLDKSRTLEEKVRAASVNPVKQKKKNNGCIYAFSIILALSFIGSLLDGDNETTGDNTSRNQEADAKVACAQAIEKSAIYGANPSAIFGAGAAKIGTGYLVRFSEFEINNAFGAKKKSTATCRYDTSTERITSLRINGEQIF